MSEQTTLRDTFAAAAMTGIIAASDDSEIKQPQAEFLSRQAWLVADAMLRERARNGAPVGRETVTDHDAASAAKAAELARSPGQSPRGTGDTTREPVDVPATWQDECCAVENAFARSGVRPTWPDDEPANIGPMAAAMADEINRLRDVVRQLTSSLLSRPLQSERDQIAKPSRETAVVQAESDYQREIASLRSEIDRLRLTDAERAALRLGQRLLRESYAERPNSDFVAAAAAIDGLLAKHGGDV